MVHNLDDENLDELNRQKSIQNIEVIFREILPDNVKLNQNNDITDETDDFIINLVEEKIPIQKPVQQMEFSFDFNEKVALHDDNQTTEIKFDNKTSITYQLSDFEEKDNKKDEKVVAKNLKTEDAELLFEFKTNDNPKADAKQDFETKKDDFSPLNVSISDYKKTSEMRKNNLRQFNHVFNNNFRNIDELEREPAYKRLNMELNEEDTHIRQQSRTSIQTDENGLQIRTNNSFLHDNVD